MESKFWSKMLKILSFIVISLFFLLFAIKESSDLQIFNSKGRKTLTPGGIDFGLMCNLNIRREIIKESGLNRMKRNHIHMVTIDKKPQHRIRAEVWVLINMQRAMQRGIDWRHKNLQSSMRS